MGPTKHTNPTQLDPKYNIYGKDSQITCTHSDWKVQQDQAVCRRADGKAKGCQNGPYGSHHTAAISVDQHTGDGTRTQCNANLKNTLLLDFFLKK